MSSNNETSQIKRLSTATVIWYQPKELPLKYSVLGDSNPSSETKESWRESSMKGILPLVDSIKKNVPSEVESFLRKNGVKGGNDATIMIMLKEVSWTGVKPGAQLIVAVMYKDTKDPPWRMTIAAAGSVLDSTDSTAKKYTTKITEELIRLGFV